MKQGLGLQCNQQIKIGLNKAKYNKDAYNEKKLWNALELISWIDITLNQNFNIYIYINIKISMIWSHTKSKTRKKTIEWEILMLSVRQICMGWGTLKYYMDLMCIKLNKQMTIYWGYNATKQL